MKHQWEKYGEDHYDDCELFIKMRRCTVCGRTQRWVQYFKLWKWKIGEWINDP